ncbi:hypothetical protein RSOLAG22IIIB_13397 [Rhizoctonia solani]|uniref:Uncharacterized protein n=1 Tax=Rhizoctonia solani TaxID=456999 RepID=A0A0K6FML2_9AGAM|nr:hypothetical protein RSOLAG22IIIB_13397 [Rhizoctonia solani]
MSTQKRKAGADNDDSVIEVMSDGDSDLRRVLAPVASHEQSITAKKAKLNASHLNSPISMIESRRETLVGRMQPKPLRVAKSANSSADLYHSTITYASKSKSDNSNIPTQPKLDARAEFKRIRTELKEIRADLADIKPVLEKLHMLAQSMKSQISQVEEAPAPPKTFKRASIVSDFHHN